MSSNTRAFLAVSIFLLAGISGFVLEEIWQDQVGSLLASMYVLLVVNTFFSVRFFTSIVPSDLGQKIIDAILVVFYLLVAFSMQDETLFFFFMFCLFLVASLKYALLLKHTSYEKILQRKIQINLIGALAWAAALGGVLFGYPLASAWLMLVAFGVANVYLLIINPMYRL